MTLEGFPLLDQIALSRRPARHCDPAELGQLAAELREFLIRTVATRGGHFAAGLGTVELTIALHYVYNTPRRPPRLGCGPPGLSAQGAHRAARAAADASSSAAASRRSRTAPKASTTPSAPATPAPRSARRWAWPSPPPSVGEEPARGGRDRRRRDERRHGLRGAEPRRQPARRPAGGAQRQRDVDLRGRGRAVAVFRARAGGTLLFAAAQGRQEGAEPDADHARTGAPLRGTHEGHGAARHACSRRWASTTSAPSTATT